MSGLRPLFIKAVIGFDDSNEGSWEVDSASNLASVSQPLSLDIPSSLREENEEEELPPSLSLPLSSVARVSFSARHFRAVLSELRLSQTMKDTGSRL